MQNRAVARVVEGRQPLPGLCDIVGMLIGGKESLYMPKLEFRKEDSKDGTSLVV